MSFIFHSITDKIFDREKSIREFENFTSLLNKSEMEFLFYTLQTTLDLFVSKDDINDIKDIKEIDFNISKVFDLLKTEKNIKYLLHNIQKTHFIINSEKDTLNRIKPYYITERILGNAENDKLCSFELRHKGMKSKLIGQGMGGITYKVTHDNLPKPIAAKIMDMDDENNMKELIYYERLKNLVLSYKTPNLPLTWTNLQCGRKCVFIDPSKLTRDKDRWKKIKKGKCALVFAELFDGDLSHNAPKSTEMLYSIIFQILCGLYCIDKENLYHGDLNSGNVLYLNLEEQKNEKGDEKEYIKYKYNDEVFYIKHLNKLWCLWDFEYMNTKGHRIHENFTPEYLAGGMIGDKNVKEIEMKWGSYHDKNSKFISGSWLFDLVDIMYGFTFLAKGILSPIAKRIYENAIELFMENNLNINPIESIPRIFKGVKYDNFVYSKGEDPIKDEKSISYFIF